MNTNAEMRMIAEYTMIARERTNEEIETMLGMTALDERFVNALKEEKALRSVIPSGEMGSIYHDPTPTSKFRTGRWFLVMPTTTGHNRVAYMTRGEAVRQREALIVTDPALAGEFRLAISEVALSPEDHFGVAGASSTFVLADLHKSGYGVAANSRDRYHAIPEVVSLTAWYEERPVIRAWLRFGDRIRVGRRTFTIGRGSNSDHITLAPVRK